MGTMLVLLVLSCLVIAVYGGVAAQWRRIRCPACRSYNPAGATRCAYCTTWLSREVAQA